MQNMAYINYLLLDAARMAGGINKAKELNSQHASLFSGRSEKDLADVAPYIFSYHPESDFANWYMKEGWGKGWGIMVRSLAPVEDLHAHCRRFLLSKDENKQEIYFRFYDPRVLSIFLPTCSSEQLRDFFGPIDYFMIEDEDPNFGQMIWLEDYELRTKRIDRGELVSRMQQELTPDNRTSPLPPRKPSGTNKGSTDKLSQPSEREKTAHPDEEDNNSKWNKFFFE